jgi:hypothetical protein
VSADDLLRPLMNSSSRRRATALMALAGASEALILQDEHLKLSPS